jgi:hypothetical protein
MVCMVAQLTAGNYTEVQGRPATVAITCPLRNPSSGLSVAGSNSQPPEVITKFMQHPSPREKRCRICNMPHSECHGGTGESRQNQTSEYARTFAFE